MGLERITQLRKAKGLTIEQLAEKASIPISTIKKISAGITTNPNFETVLAISQALGCSLEEFMDSPVFKQLSNSEQEHINNYRSLDDHGRKAVNATMMVELERMEELREQELEKEQRQSDNKIIKFERRSIPDYDVPTSAGPGQFLDVSSYAMVPLGENDPQDASFIVTVKGNSMEPNYCDGDKVFVKQQPGVEVGEVGLFMVDNETYIKEMGRGELISQNPKCPNIKLRDGVAAYCFGKVVGVKKPKPIAMVAAYNGEIKGVHAFESPVTEDELKQLLKEFDEGIGDTHMDEFD